MPRLRDFQREDVDFIKRHGLRVLVASAMGTGKAQPVSSKVLTPSGWRPIGDLQPGDKVCDPDGGIGVVLSVHPQGRRPVFRVSTADGESTRCCGEHLWTVQTASQRHRGTWQTVSTRRLLDRGLVDHRPGRRDNHKWFIPVSAAITFSRSEEPLPVDPYLLGVLLGDGSLLTSVRFSSADDHIVQRVKAASAGTLRVCSRPSRPYDYSVVARRGSPNPLKRALTALGVWGKKSYEKFIPSQYLTSSTECRWALLRGLMDTDGTVTKGKSSFTTTSPFLARNVVGLVQSLGGLVSTRTRTTTYTYKGKKRQGRTSYRLYIRLPDNPFSLPRKANAWVPDRLARAISDVQPDGEDECVCIRVSTRRQLYITDGHIVTHNTVIAVVSILETGKWSLPALIVAPASVTRPWKREFKTWAPGLRVQLVRDMSTPLDPDANVYITSWALLDPRGKEFSKIGIRTLVGDEAHFAKNPEALRSQALRFLAHEAQGILLLTGTPIINTKEELEVLHALYGTQIPPMIRRLLEDVAPDIPPKTRSYIPIELRPRARADYDRAASDFEAWLRREKERLIGEGLAEYEVERALSAEAFVRVGYLRRLVGKAKVHAAADWIARAVRMGEPVVCFLEHQLTLRRLSKALRKQRIRHAIIEGKTLPVRRQRYIDAFQANEFPVILGTKAAKEGITLHAARHLLFVERYFTSSEEEQAEDRIRRIGQKHPTTMWYLHAVNTIDDRIDRIVNEKRRIIRGAIGSRDVFETNRKAVRALIRGWDTFVQRDPVRATKLGLKEPLDPLPSPGSTHALVFERPRWTPRSAATWCKMNGYLPSSYEMTEDRVRIVTHPVAVFTPNSFTATYISTDIKALCGKRLSKRNEAIVRRGLARRGYANG